MIHLLPPATVTSRIYSIPATALNASTDFDRSKLADSHTAELDHHDAETIDTRLSDHQKLGHPSLKRMRHLDIEGLLIFKRWRGRWRSNTKCATCPKLCRKWWSKAKNDPNNRSQAKSTPATDSFWYIQSWSKIEHRSFLQTREIFIHRKQSQEAVSSAWDLRRQSRILPSYFRYLPYQVYWWRCQIVIICCHDVKSLIPSTPELQKTGANCAALHVAYTAALIKAQQFPNLQRKEPLTYKQDWAANDARDLVAACDLEMTKLRDFGCREVHSKSSFPNNTHIVGSRWIFKYKIDEHGAVTRHRSWFVAKGFTQIKDVTFFENFAPVASYVTIRTVFALTALPMFTVLQYDV